MTDTQAPVQARTPLDTQIDTCHCIIRHPEAAKFLVVKHEESWAPPVLRFPSGNVHQRVAMINQGMADKYGLRTRVLRPLMHAPHYHCVEMELASQQAARRLQAVWVDQTEYLRTRTAPGELPDPFAIWFEQQSSDAARQRPPFHQPGWFGQAAHWVDFQLDSLGIQARGSLKQFRQGAPNSCLLRVGGIDGWIYFKTSYGFGSGAAEASLLAAMSARWPKTLFKPLAVDTRRNWMLNRDYFKHGKSAREVQQIQPFYAALAQLQVDSLNCLGDLAGLGCGEIGLGVLLDFCRLADQHQSRWQEGGGRLNDSELQKLRAALQALAGDCEKLAEFNLPAMLVHPDFHADKMVLSGTDHRIIDWAGAVIAPPFLTLLPLIRRSRAVGSDDQSIPPALLADLKQHYLPTFADFAPVEVLSEALQLTARLEPLWTMLGKLHSLENLEPGTPYYYFQVVSLQALARQVGQAA